MKTYCIAIFFTCSIFSHVIDKVRAWPLERLDLIEIRETFASASSWAPDGSDFYHPMNDRANCGMGNLSPDEDNYICNPDTVIDNDQGWLYIVSSQIFQFVMVTRDGQT